MQSDSSPSILASDIAPTRSRLSLVILAAATIGLGLATRRFPAMFPDLVARDGGDALWTVLVFWLLALLVPGAGGLFLAASALLVSFAVEASQLLDWPWLASIRSNRFGALVLGQGFLWTDLVRYTAGAAFAFAIDLVTRRLFARR